MAVAPDSLPARVAACLERHVSEGRLTVGYSGGLDSSVLLHLLAGFRQTRPATLNFSSNFSPIFSFNAVHVHHGLSPQADAWAQHCAQTCLALDVALETHYVEVKPTGEGLEAAARNARYRVYAQLDTDFLLLAHHRDDQAETVLLQLLRGAGMKGLAAMPEARWLNETRLLLRPLLTTTRVDIAAWARERGIRWVEDESNRDTRLTRNALRHSALPSLVERFPDAPRALAQAAVQFAEAAVMLDELADLDGREAIDATGLAIPVLSALPEPRARNLLRRFLACASVELHHAALCEALRQLLQARQDAQVRVDFGAVSLRRYRQRAILTPTQPLHESESAQWEIRWQGEACLDLGRAGRLYFNPVIGEGVNLVVGRTSIRSRLGGERIRLAPNRPRRTLKNLLREAGIAAWRRQLLPLLYVEETLAWVADIGADCDYLAKPGQPGWLISWQAPQSTEA